MKWRVYVEKSYSEGVLETWFHVRPTNKILAFFDRYLDYAPLAPCFTNPYSNKDDALKEANLRNLNKWNKKIKTEIV